MKHKHLASIVLAVIAVLFLATSPISAADPTSAVANESSFKIWASAYDSAGGDHNVIVNLSSSRVYVTEKVATTGFVRIDLIDGDVEITLVNLDRVGRYTTVLSHQCGVDH